MEKGFTIIELIVAISIMAIIGVIFTNTLTQTLRGQNKVKVLNQVKQNGQVVLDRLSYEIRQAEKVICIGVNDDNTGQPDNTVVLYNRGVYTRFRLYPPGSQGNCSSGNGCIKRNEFTSDNLPGGIFDGTFNSQLCADRLDQDLQKVELVTDTDEIYGVSVDYDMGNISNKLPAFGRGAVQPGYSDIVYIRFRVFQGVGAGKTYEAAASPEGILFATAVQVRGGK